MERAPKNLFWSSVAAIVVIISFRFINPLLIFNFISTVCFWAAVGAAGAAALALIHSLCFGHRKAGAHISYISATCRYHHHHQNVPFVRMAHSERVREREKTKGTAYSWDFILFTLQLFP